MRCTYLCLHTHTNINGCCLLKGFVVCHLVRIAIRFLSISFRSITIPFDLVDITNLLLTGHIIFLAAALCCNNFTIPHTIFTFYTSKARIWFVALRSVLCCFYLSFSCYSFDLDCRVELSVCIVAIVVSIYPGYLVVYECVCLCSFVHFSSSTESVFRQAHPQHILFNIIPEMYYSAHK